MHEALTADDPCYPGGTVLKAFEVNVNLRPMRLKVLHTGDSPSCVARYYVEELSKLGWRVQQPPSGTTPVSSAKPAFDAGVERVEIQATKGKILFTVSAFRDEPTGGAYVFLRSEETGRPKYRFVAPRQATERSRVPIFPGVKEVLLVEDGRPQGTSTLLFDTDATPEYVARYYRQKLGARKNSTTRGLVQHEGWTCDTYQVNGRRVGINLLRIDGENRTSVLLVVSGSNRQRLKSGVLSRWLAGNM